MAIELKVPSLGESITQATVGAWLKREGDTVQVDEPLVEVESEKATVALPAPSAGVLKRILKPSGTTVSVGEVIGELEKGNGKLAAVPAPAAAPAAPPLTPTLSPPSGEREKMAATMSPSPPQGERARARGPDQAAPPLTSPSGEKEKSVTRLPPSARRLLAEHGLTRDDVVRALDARTAPAPAPADGATAPQRPPGPRERLVPMSPLRRTVARRLLEAQSTAAILTTFNQVDMSQVLALREKHGPAFEKKHGVKLGFMSFFVKGAVEGLKAFPSVNAEVRGTDILYKDHYDIGVAVGGGKGLVVPVVRDADRLSFAQVELGIADLAKKARENRITMEDLQGGTFTISNGGIYGSLLSTPILNPPQSGILGLHKIEKRPVAGPNDEVLVRPMMYLALSYDHRLVDGREAVSFLVRVKECIEDPDRILLEI